MGDCRRRRCDWRRLRAPIARLRCPKFVAAAALVTRAVARLSVSPAPAVLTTRLATAAGRAILQAAVHRCSLWEAKPKSPQDRGLRPECPRQHRLKRLWPRRGTTKLKALAPAQLQAPKARSTTTARRPYKLAQLGRYS